MENTILKSVNLLKNKKVHIDLIADEYYSIENVKMNQETIFKKTDEKVRNSYFSTTTTEDIQISANLTKNNDMIPMKDEQSGKIYFESLLCEENCLEEHIRNNKETVCFKHMENIYIKCRSCSNYRLFVIIYYFVFKKTN